MLRPSRRPVLGLVLAGTLAGLGPPANAASEEPTGWVELTAGPGTAMHNPTAGGSAMWPVDVHVRGEPGTELELVLEPEPAASDLLRKSPLNAADGLQVSLLEPGSSVSDGAFVLLTAFLAQEVPSEVQGSRTQIAVRVHGSGDDAGTRLADDAGAGSLPGQPAAPPSASLANTGARLGGFAVLGLLAVAVGFGLARLRAA